MNTIAEHPVAPEQIMAFFDGELSAADAQNVAAHLDGCSACASLVGQFRDLSQSLTQWSVALVPQSVEDAVKGFAARTSATSKSGKPPAPFLFGIWNGKFVPFAVTGIAACALLMVGVEISDSYRNARIIPHRSEVVELPNKDTDTAGYDAPASVPPSLPAQSPMNVATPAIAAMAQQTSALDGNAAASPAASMQLNSPTTSAAPMIAHTASLAITVKDLSAARASLDAILARHQGYAAQLTVESTANFPRSVTASLRIPASGLSSAIGDLKTLGRVERESQSGEDVSQQHTDLAERIKTARATEESFRGILQQRTGKISDVLEVEQSIARVRGEIEAMEAEQTRLEHRVDYATIELQLNEEYKEEIPSAAFSLRFHNASVAGYRNASEIVTSIILFLVQYVLSILIWLALVCIPALLIWRYRKALSRL